jgi:16S rRNA C1402 (ribose-2'-O) methylase RsmI
MVAREITKIYESFIEGTPVEVSEYYKAHPGEIRGEFVVIVEP